MNNYSSPRIIRILNKLDTLVGSICMIMILLLFSPEVGLVSSWVHNFTIALMIFACIYCAIAMAKVCSYIYCIFQGYRVTMLGMIIYTVWTLSVSIFVAMLLIASLLELIGPILV